MEALQERSVLKTILSRNGQDLKSHLNEHGGRILTTCHDCLGLVSIIRNNRADLLEINFKARTQKIGYRTTSPTAGL